MNKIWTFVLLASIMLMITSGEQNIMNIILSGCEKAVTLSYSLISIYAFWLGILEICDACGVSEKIANLLSRPIDFLFDKPNKETKKQIAINLSSNILGMGNIATPSGIKAMTSLDDKSGKINKAQMIFMLLNTSSLQILPTTIIGLRISSNSQNASSIIIPTILASFISTFCGLILLYFINKIIKKFRKKDKK